MTEKMFCPIHADVQMAIREIKVKQDSRLCLTNESDIRHLKDNLTKVEIDNIHQWSSINKLRWIVAMGAGGAGVLAFLGSIIGVWLKK